ncbi:hypothetical protein AMJ87_02350 [candidate division WOR_3 bacterium SM23_60]|uniref:Uncharacterized protein n=1 Tax=candidate division WOR_3 bacterium SM23_60 TaxID=1703780 RepID=A0A0S8GJY3_UNCW3|nr:MAG: hypothetical protein AMJ87_02350 [candidate division WOR_3 bacterium SM23_60]
MGDGTADGRVLRMVLALRAVKIAMQLKNVARAASCVKREAFPRPAKKCGGLGTLIFTIKLKI